MTWKPTYLKATFPAAKKTRTKLRPDQNLVLQVFSIDNHQLVQLSKNIIEEESKEGEDKFHQGKTVHSITTHVADVTHRTVEELYSDYVWPFYDSEFEHPFSAFKSLAAEGRRIWDDDDDEEDEEEKRYDEEKGRQKEERRNVIDAFTKVIKQRLSSPPMKLGAHVETVSFSEDGIDDIKSALKKAQSEFSEVKIQLISSPLFLFFITTTDEERGGKMLLDAIEVAKKEITPKSGNCTIVKRPYIISR